MWKNCENYNSNVKLKLRFNCKRFYANFFSTYLFQMGILKNNSDQEFKNVIFL